MLSTVLFVSGLSIALGCAPGSTTGPTYSSATYSFTILPPLSWSWTNDTQKDAAQKDAADEAKAQIIADVTSCLTKTLNENNVPTTSVNYVINLDTIEAIIIPNPCSKTAGEYVAYKGSLYYKCGANLDMAESVGSIAFKSDTPITANQWNAIAVNVQDRLTALKVIFTENVKVKYT